MKFDLRNILGRHNHGSENVTQKIKAADLELAWIQFARNPGCPLIEADSKGLLELIRTTSLGEIDVF